MNVTTLSRQGFLSFGVSIKKSWYSDPAFENPPNEMLKHTTSYTENTNDRERKVWLLFNHQLCCLNNSTGISSTLLSKIVYSHICLISVSSFKNRVWFRFYCFVSLVWKLKTFEIFFLFFFSFLELMLLRSDILHARKEPRSLWMKGKTKFGDT